MTGPSANQMLEVKAILDDIAFALYHAGECSFTKSRTAPSFLDLSSRKEPPDSCDSPYVENTEWNCI